MLRQKLYTTALHSFTAMALIFSVSAAHADEFGDALTSTYNTNPRIKSERESLEALNETVSQAISGWLPSITGNVIYGRGREDYPGGEDWDQYFTQDTKTLSLSQPVFNGGGTIARTKSARNLVKAGQARLDAVEQDVLLRSIASYMDVVQGQSVLELSRNNVNVLQKQLQATQDRFDVGEVTRTDVAQSDARVARAQSDANQSGGELESARAGFERLVGYKPANSLPMPTQMPPLPASLEEAKERALANNPSFAYAAYQARAAADDVWVNASTLLPSLSIEAQARRDDSDRFSGGGVSDEDQRALLNLRIPLYQSGAEYSRVREATNTRERRRFEETDSRNETVENVTRAWERLQTARATIQSNQSAIKAADVALEGVKQEQQYGARTTLDVLNAEQELFVARVNLVRSQRDERVAMYNLLAVTGDLTPKNLGLTVQEYNAEAEFDKVKHKVIGF